MVPRSGTDIDNLGPIQQLPADYQPQILGNFRLAGEALSTIAADIASDARRLVGLSAQPRPGPASSSGDAFVVGKRGGVYQVHNPGLSLLLFPGYFLDRFALTWTSHPFAQGPAHLYATNLVMLLLYLLWGAALFRRLAAHTGSQPVSCAMACTAVLSLPATAFAYRSYPEAAGDSFSSSSLDSWLRRTARDSGRRSDTGLAGVPRGCTCGSATPRLSPQR